MSNRFRKNKLLISKSLFLAFVLNLAFSLNVSAALLSVSKKQPAPAATAPTTKTSTTTVPEPAVTVPDGAAPVAAEKKSVYSRIAEMYLTGLPQNNRSIDLA